MKRRVNTPKSVHTLDERQEPPEEQAAEQRLLEVGNSKEEGVGARNKKGRKVVHLESKRRTKYTAETEKKTGKGQRTGTREGRKEAGASTRTAVIYC